MKTRLVIFIIFLFLWNTLFSQEKPLEIWTLSTGNLVKKFTYDIVSQQYPFRVKHFVDDIATGEDFLDEIEKHNKKVWRKLLKIGFSDIEEKFLFDIKEEEKKVQKIISLLDKEWYYEILKNLKEEGLQESIKLLKLDNENYLLLLYGFKMNNIREEVKKKIFININRLEVKVCD